MKKEFLEEKLAFYEEKVSSFKDMMTRTTAYLNEMQKELIQKNTEIYQSISYAENIQNNLLPDMSVFNDIFSEEFYLVKQRNNIGGDMVFAKRFERTICFGLMDCTGHGVPGALISMLGYTFTMESIHESDPENPAEILNKLDLKFRNFFKKENSTEFLYNSMDSIVCSYNIDHNTLKFSTAGRPLWYKSEQGWERMKSGKKSIGSSQKGCFKNENKKVQPEDEVFLFSDGVIDQFGGITDKKFMSRRVLEILNNNSQLSLTERMKLLEVKLNSWQGPKEQTDDISFIALKL